MEEERENAVAAMNAREKKTAWRLVSCFLVYLWINSYITSHFSTLRFCLVLFGFCKTFFSSFYNYLEILFIYIIKHVYFIRYKNKQKGKMVIFLSQHSQSEG